SHRRREEDQQVERVLDDVHTLGSCVVDQSARDEEEREMYQAEEGRDDNAGPHRPESWLEASSHECQPGTLLPDRDQDRDQNHVEEISSWDLRRVVRYGREGVRAVDRESHAEQQHRSAEQCQHVPLRSGFELVVVAPQPACSILAVGDTGDHEGDAGQAEDRYQEDSDLGRDVYADYPETLRAYQGGQEQNPTDRVKDQEEGGERVLADGALEPGRRRGLGNRSHGYHLLRSVQGASVPRAITGSAHGQELSVCQITCRP